MSPDGKLVKGKRGSKVPRNGLKVLSFTVLRDNKQIVQRSVLLNLMTRVIAIN